MRRSEKEIKDIKEIEAILEDAKVCRIALCENGVPYIVPMNFGYRNNTLYLHSAREGKKIDILKNNCTVAFEVDTRTELITGDEACSWSYRFLSVVGLGTATILDDDTEKRHALDVIMEKYSGQTSFSYNEKALKVVCAIKIDITEITGKKSNY